MHFMKYMLLYRVYMLLSVFVVALSFLLPVVCNADGTPGQLNYHAAGDLPGENDHPHNLSSRNTGATIHAPSGVGEETRICIFCHTPHSSSSDAPLWNRRDISGGFPLYARVSEIEIDTIPEAKYGGGNTYPNGSTRLCLSCHDGVTAIGEVINPGSGVSPLGGLGPLPGGHSAIIDLSLSHPVSFTYNSTVAASIISQKGIANSGDYVIPSGDYADMLDGDVTETGALAQRRMQCTSCHDPHKDTKNEVDYFLPMWRYDLTKIEAKDYEETCEACHQGGVLNNDIFDAGGVNRLPVFPPPGPPDSSVHPIP